MDNAHVGSPREKMTWFRISGAAPYMVWGYFWSFLLLQDIFPSGVALSFKSSKTNILRSQFILKNSKVIYNHWVEIAILDTVKWLQVTYQNEDPVLTYGRWLIMTVKPWGFFCQQRSMQFHAYFHLITEYSSNILSKHSLKQTGWSDHVSSNHLQWFKNNGKFCHPKSDCNHLWRVVIYKRFRLCKGFDWKNLVFWIRGGLWEVVSYMRWYNMDVQLYVLL